MLADYNADGYIILDEYVTAPSKYQGVIQSGDSDFTKWIDGSSEHELVRSTNTVVHEMNHGYTGKLYLKMLKDAGKSVGDNHYSVFYIGNRKGVLVEHSDVFTTNEINAIFPRNLISFRYKTYVYPSEPIMGTQQDGVYGLLDELNAYYWGTKASFDFYEYYNTKYNTPEGWNDFFNGFYSTYYAYLEFKSYILVYMMYAKQNHADIYDQIMQNKDFLYALKKVDENWTNLIVDYKALKNNIIKEQKSRGIEITESDEFLMIGYSGLGTFKETYLKLKTELDKSKDQSLAKGMGLASASGPDM